MRTRPGMHPQLCLLLFFLFALTNAKPFFPPSAVAINERDLIGSLFDGNLLPDGGATPPSSLDLPHTTTVHPTEPGRIRTPSVDSTPATAIIHSFTPTTATPLITTSSIDSAFVVQTPSPAFSPEDPSNTPSPSSTPISTGWDGDTSSTPPAELTEWKVIGIGVITVTLIAILVLLISFFDSWWGFLRSVTCGRKPDEGEGEETMACDVEELRKDWEVKLAGEDGHRYPTLPSMDSIQKKARFL